MEERYLQALKRIKAIVDAYKDNRIHISKRSGVFNDRTHTYDVSSVMAVIGNYVNDALR